MCSTGLKPHFLHENSQKWSLFVFLDPSRPQKRYFITQDHPQNTRGILQYLQKHIKCRYNNNGVTYGCTKPKFRGFLTEKCRFPGFGPPAGVKKCDERAKPLKIESLNTYPSKILHTSSPLYFKPLNSHFSLVWF